MGESPVNRPWHTVSSVGRREFLVSGAPLFIPIRADQPDPIIVSVQAMFDQGAHSGRGLTDREVSLFNSWQETARRNYAVSGIRFDVHVLQGAYMRAQGYSEVPEKFLVRNMINLFVTDTLGYDVDKDRTGGVSIGPRALSRWSGGDPFYKTFLGLRDARETTLEHEYAHHFTLDTRNNTSEAGNFWADLRNDYWLWRQRHGAPISAFRDCAHSPWAAVRKVLACASAVRLIGSA
jgi:hypothetical protein